MEEGRHAARPVRADPSRSQGRAGPCAAPQTPAGRPRQRLAKWKRPRNGSGNPERLAARVTAARRAGNRGAGGKIGPKFKILTAHNYPIHSASAVVTRFRS